MTLRALLHRLFHRRRNTYPLHGHTLDFTALSRRVK